MTTIVLLGCSISLLASNTGIGCTHLSTGGVVVEDAIVKDSVLVSYNDLRLANSKLIELDYEKKINNKLRSVITNDSIIIKDYKVLNERINKDCKKAISQRNIMFGSATVLFITTIITLLVK